MLASQNDFLCSYYDQPYDRDLLPRRLLVAIAIAVARPEITSGPHMVSGVSIVGQQSQVTGSFDGQAHPVLLLARSAGAASGIGLATAEVLAGRASPGVTEPAKSEYDGPEPRRWRLSGRKWALSPIRDRASAV